MKNILLYSILLCYFSYANENIPVMYGGETQEDACGSWGEIQGISKHGDGFIAIRNGPGSKFKIKDKIYYNSTQVTLCDFHGKWIGIVYGDTDCGTSSPIPKRQPYKGKCKVGWIYEKYVRLTAG